MQPRTGLVQVYTGEGKGKTTAALGLAIRAWGRNFRVVIIQFLKPADSGEYLVLNQLPERMEVKSFGRAAFVYPGSVKEKDIEAAEQGLDYARMIVVNNSADLLVLDEINCAMALGLIEARDVVQLIRNRPETMEMVLTGRGAPEEIIRQADLVTKMEEIKHPFGSGIKARRGIEY